MAQLLTAPGSPSQGNVGGWVPKDSEDACWAPVTAQLPEVAGQPAAGGRRARLLGPGASTQDPHCLPHSVFGKTSSQRSLPVCRPHQGHSAPHTHTHLPSAGCKKVPETPNSCSQRHHSGAGAAFRARTRRPSLLPPARGPSGPLRAAVSILPRDQERGVGLTPAKCADRMPSFPPGWPFSGPGRDRGGTGPHTCLTGSWRTAGPGTGRWEARGTALGPCSVLSLQRRDRQEAQELPCGHKVP